MKFLNENAPLFGLLLVAIGMAVGATVWVTTDVNDVRVRVSESEANLVREISRNTIGINENTAGIAANAEAIGRNAAAIAGNAAGIAGNADGIAGNAAGIAANAAGIAANADAIAANAAGIAEINERLARIEQRMDEILDALGDYSGIPAWRAGFGEPVGPGRPANGVANPNGQR